jgi:hypothetical protein
VQAAGGAGGVPGLGGSAGAVDLPKLQRCFVCC